MKLLHHLTFRTFPGVGVPAMRLLDGVLFEVPYNMSSCVCLVFFICCYQKKKRRKNAVILWWHVWQGRVSVVLVKLIAHPFQFLLLLFSAVMIPLLLHILKKFLPVDKEFFSMLLLPNINLALQTLLQLKILVGCHVIGFSINSSFIVHSLDVNICFTTIDWNNRMRWCPHLLVKPGNTPS